jgi:outer membrane protein
MNPFFKPTKISIPLLLSAMLFCNTDFAQEKNVLKLVLSMDEAINLAKKNNDWITMAKLNKEVSESELKEVKSHVLPHIVADAGGKRLSNVTLYEHGLHDSESLPPPPSSYQANFGIEASFNLYSGRKHEAQIEEYEIKTKLSDIKMRQQSGSVSLQVIQNYLEILRLSKLDSIYKEQISREELRLKNINSLYKNGKVTRSDVLRAEIGLSNEQFARKENQSDIQIFNNRLTVLLKLPEETKLILSDTAIVKETPDWMNIEAPSEKMAYNFLAAKQNIELQEAKIKGAKSNYYPSISLISAYEYSYPNYLKYPNVDQAYSIGFVGFKMQYSISSLYQNNHKVRAEKERLNELKVNENAISDDLKLEISSLKIKLEDTKEKMEIAQKNIQQSKVNLKIVSTKYFNQLALLTDLLEADNLYLQSKYKLIEAQTSLLNYYYQILYTTGKI